MRSDERGKTPNNSLQLTTLYLTQSCRLQSVLRTQQSTKRFMGYHYLCRGYAANLKPSFPRLRPAELRRPPGKRITVGIDLYRTDERGYEIESHGGIIKIQMPWGIKILSGYGLTCNITDYQYGRKQDQAYRR